MSENVRQRAVLDTNVLLPIALCDTLLRVADAGLYGALWSEEILDELERNLVRLRRATPANARRRRDAMIRSLPDATITGYEPLIPQMTNDPKDRHVLAAAVHIGADRIVTHNLRHFPASSLSPYGIVAVSADMFLRGLLERAPDVLARTIREQAADLCRPPQLARQVLDNLAAEAPTFVREIMPFFVEGWEHAAHAHLRPARHRASGNQRADGGDGDCRTRGGGLGGGRVRADRRQWR